MRSVFLLTSPTKFFNDRVLLDASYYNRISKDQIVNLTVAPASGFSAAAINAGQMSNRGVELLLTIHPLKPSRDFDWTTTFNYGKNDNNVDALGGVPLPKVTYLPRETQA